MADSFKKKNIPVSIMILITAASFILYAFSTGVTGKTLKNGNGCDCHGLTASEEVNVIIAGPDTLLAGESADYTLIITGGDLVRGGTNIASSDGILTPITSDLQIMSGELTHTAPKAPEGNSVVFQFTYTAPASAGIQTLYANGNSVNFNGTNTGDKWNFAPNKIINVVSVTSVDGGYTAITYELKQNYPNPFNPSTKISFALAAAGNTEIVLFNSLGEKVREIFTGYLSQGTHSVDFNGSGLPSGIYYYKMITGEFTDVKKMMLIK